MIDTRISSCALYLNTPRGKVFRTVIWRAFWGSGKSDLYLLGRDWESKEHGYSAASYTKILDDNLGLVLTQDNAFIYSDKKNKSLVQRDGY